MTYEEIEQKFKETYPDFVYGDTPLSPYFDIWCYAIEIMEQENEQLEKQIEKMKRHCNCKHRDSEGYCEVKRTYLIDLSYDGCDKWELEND